MRAHPLWRGFWLAAVIAAGLVLMGPAGFVPLGSRACAGAMVVGGFLGALPGRLRKGAHSLPRVRWQRCLRGFLCGGGFALALALIGDAGLFSAFLTGSAGAWAAFLMALTGGFTTVRIMGRRA